MLAMRALRRSREVSYPPLGISPPSRPPCSVYSSPCVGSSVRFSCPPPLFVLPSSSAASVEGIPWVRSGRGLLGVCSGSGYRPMSEVWPSKLERCIAHGRRRFWRVSLRFRLGFELRLLCRMLVLSRLLGTLGLLRFGFLGLNGVRELVRDAFGIEPGPLSR